VAGVLHLSQGAPAAPQPQTWGPDHGCMMWTSHTEPVQSEACRGSKGCRNPGRTALLVVWHGGSPVLPCCPAAHDPHRTLQGWQGTYQSVQN
jgi:hypothetical protein